MGGARVYIGGLPYDVREKDLEGFFRGYGRLRDISIKNGYGFVEFDSYRDADVAAYALNGKDLSGKRVIVQRARGAPKRVKSLRSGTGRPCFKCNEAGHIAKDCRSGENGKTRRGSPDSRKVSLEDDLVEYCQKAFGHNFGRCERRSSCKDDDDDTDRLVINQRKENEEDKLSGSLKQENSVPVAQEEERSCSYEQNSEVLESAGTGTILSYSEDIPDSTAQRKVSAVESFEEYQQLPSSSGSAAGICNTHSTAPIRKLNDPQSKSMPELDEIGSCELLSEHNGIPTLELLSRSSNHVNRGGEQMLSCVQLAVYEQLKQWGIGSETPNTRTRGRSKTRKSNNNKFARSENGANRLVETKLKNWDVTVKVPILIKETCDFLRQHITTEGIFRKSGLASRVQTLMFRFMDLKKHEEFTFSQSDTVIDVAAALKQYLREMDMPLIPYNTHDLFRRCVEVSTESSKEEAVLLCTCLLSELSISILTYLIEFLTEVVQHSASNRMSFENLAIVIGPSIMPVERKKNDKAKELEQEKKFVQTHIKIVEILFRNGHKLGCLSPELQKKVESDYSLQGSEDELENDGSNRRGRSGSLTRVLGFLKKVARNRTGDTPAPVPQTPDFSSFTHTPVMKSSKRRCLDGNMFSLQKKKTLLDSIRKNPGKEDDRRYALVPNTPKSVAGLLTCPPPVIIDPSPTKTDYYKQQQTPKNSVRLTAFVTPSTSVLRRATEKNFVTSTLPRITPEEDYSPTNSINRTSPKRCTLKRGRPNTLRAGLPRPTVQSSPRKSLIPRYVSSTPTPQK